MAISMLRLLQAEPGPAAQLKLVLIYGTLWHIAIDRLAKKVFQPWISKRPWRDQWLQLTARAFENFGIKLDSEQQAFEAGCEYLAILCQHAVGGALCVPSVIGFRSVGALAMARHGALCEAGWEFQDLAFRLWQVTFGGEEGRAKNPKATLFICIAHHALGLSLVVPFNIAYGSNPHYHEMVFLLQGAAFAAMAAQNYGFALDVKTARGLRQMRVISVFVLVIMLWSRLFRFLHLARTCLSLLYSDGNIGILFAAGPSLCLMGLFNILMVADAVQKVSKYARAHLEPAQCQASKAPSSTLLGSPSPAATECGGKQSEEQRHRRLLVKRHR